MPPLVGDRYLTRGGAFLQRGAFLDGILLIYTLRHMIGSSRVGTEKGHLAAEIEGKDMLRKYIYENRIEPALHTPQLHSHIEGSSTKKLFEMIRKLLLENLTMFFR